MIRQFAASLLLLLPTFVLAQSPPDSVARSVAIDSISVTARKQIGRAHV